MTASRAQSPARGGPVFAALVRGMAPVLALSHGLVGCSPARPPGAEDSREAPAAASEAAESVARFDPAAGPFVLTYAADRGAFADTEAVDEVPERARGLVKVHMLSGPPPPAGKAWVTNLREADAAGRHRLRTVPLHDFEELALGQGLSSAVELPDGLELPEVAPVPEKIVVYKTEWCGVCKKLTAYLDAKGVPYEARDIEKDPGAAAALQARARDAGVKTGSVPVIDVGGELMVGFDRARLERLLAG